MRLGLVEDNADFRAEVAFHLRRAGFEIVLESDGTDLAARLAATPCDLLVLDLGLPTEDGLMIARRLRRHCPGLGIVMLTARGRLDDRLAGLEEGADAYLVKPVNMLELVAILHSVARRLTVPSPPAGMWTLVTASLSLHAPDGTTFALTATELALLQCLAAAAPDPVPREALARAIGHPEPDFDDRRLEVAFSRLRRKLEAAGAGEAPIRSARGRGYVFAAQVRRLPS